MSLVMAVPMEELPDILNKVGASQLAVARTGKGSSIPARNRLETLLDILSRS